MPLSPTKTARVLVMTGLVSLLLILISPKYTSQDNPTIQYHVTDRSEVIGTQASNAVIATITPVPSTTTTVPKPKKIITTTTTTPAIRIMGDSGTAVFHDVEAMIMAKFGSEGPHAIQVARCESGLHPTDTNGQYMGLFQLGNYHKHRAAKLGYSWSQMLEPGPNIDVAYDLFTEQGWTPWQCRSAIH